MGESSSSGIRNGLKLLAETHQLQAVHSIVESLRNHCAQDGGVHWEFDDAVRFVNNVQAVYRNDPRGYMLFLHIMSKVANKERSLKDMFEQVKVLFRYDPNLLEEFMNYLPSSLTNRPSKNCCSAHKRGNAPATREDALSYLRTVKLTLCDEEKYGEFLKLVNACREKSLSTDMLMSRARELFQDDQHLVDGLSFFIGRR